MFGVLRLFALALVLSVGLRSMPSFACSMDPEWVKPTNFELVEMADAIVIATAIGGTRDGPIEGRQVEFATDRSVKGTGPATISMSSFGATLTVSQPSDQQNLQVAHPSSYAGPCSRSDFTLNRQYLLFLHQDSDGEWRVSNQAFSRTKEDYAGDESIWARTVRRYVDIVSRYSPIDRFSVLATMLESGKDQFGNVLDAAERKDIEDHLSSLSPYKPTEYLLHAYAALERGDVPPNGVRSRDADRELSNADLITRSMFGDSLPPSGPDLQSMKHHVLTALVNGDHPEAMTLFRRLQHQKTDVRTLGLTLRFLAKNGAYPEAYEWISANLMTLLPKLPRKDQQRLVRDVAEVQTGDDYDNPRWRSDGRAKAEWPELALKLYTWQVEQWDQDEAYSFDNAISEIAVADYRARPELTLALAQGYDSDVREWAVRELLTPSATPRVDPSELKLPLLAILTSWTAENGEVLELVFCRGGTRRLELIRLLGESGDSLYEGILVGVAASPLTPNERSAVRTAFDKWKKRHGEEPAPGYKPDGERWVRAVPRPIQCKPDAQQARN